MTELPYSAPPQQSGGRTRFVPAACPLVAVSWQLAKYPAAARALVGVSCQLAKQRHSLPLYHFTSVRLFGDRSPNLPEQSFYTFYL